MSSIVQDWHSMSSENIHVKVELCEYSGWGYFNIGINHGFQCSNIRWITRKVFEHKAAGRVFKHLPSDPANV